MDFIYQIQTVLDKARDDGFHELLYAQKSREWQFLWSIFTF